MRLPMSVASAHLSTPSLEAECPGPVHGGTSMKRMRLIPLVALVAGACGDPGGPSPAATLSLEPRQVEAGALDQEITFTVRALDARGNEVELPGTPSLEIVIQTRVLDELPVVEDSTQRTLTVVTRGPGTAMVKAHLEGLESEAATIVVRPETPIMVGRVGDDTVSPGSEVTLRGSGLDRVPSGGLTLDGRSVTIVAADSTLLRFLVPEDSVADCVGGGLAVPGGDGVTVVGDVSIRVLRPDEIALSPGQWQVLGDAPGQCLRLPPATGSEYTLLMIDARGLLGALTGPEDALLPSTTFDVALEDRTTISNGEGSPRRASVIRTYGTVPEGDGMSASPARAGPPPADYYRYRETPWHVGDRVTVDRPLEGGEYEPATIVRVYDDRFVVAVLDRDAEYKVAERLDTLDLTMQKLIETALPLYRTTFGDAYPVTSAGSGQLLIIVSEYGLTGGITTCTSPDSPVRVPSSCVLKLSPGIAFNREYDLFLFPDLVGHELAHAWQSVYLDRVCVETGKCGGGGADRWAIEGGALFMAEEAQRIGKGRSFTQNSSWLDYSGDYPLLVGHSSIDSWAFGRGYGSSEWFFRDLVWRLTQAGVPYETAMAAVNRGTEEGWNGYYFYGGSPTEPPLVGRREGLKGRISELLGHDWDPLDALLRAAISLAVDDLTANPELQNPSILRAWERMPPSATFRTGEGTRVVGSPEGWNFAYFRIEESGRGGSLRMLTSPDNGVYWVLARTK